VGTFVAIPNAVRLIVVVAENPECGFLSIPGTGPVGHSTSRTTGFVTPCRLRFPETVSALPTALVVRAEYFLGMLAVFLLEPFFQRIVPYSAEGAIRDACFL
jgi:hypothetical protein